MRIDRRRIDGTAVLILVLVLGCNGGTQETAPATNTAQAPTGSNTAAQTPDEPKLVEQPASLHKSIEDGIALLEANKMDEFLDRFWAPGNILSIKAGGFQSWEENKKHIADSVRNSDDLRQLKEVRSQPVELSADGNDAVFRVSTPVKGLPNRLGFEKVDDRWVFYLREQEIHGTQKRVDQPEDLQRTIGQMIAVLEANKWDDFVKMFPLAEQEQMKEQLKKDGSLPKGAVELMLHELKELQSTHRKVIMSGDETQATFELSARSPNHMMKFNKIDGVWRFSDR